MDIIEEKQVRKYLEILKDIKQSYQLYDTHVHPFEVIYNSCEYHICDEQPGLFSTGIQKYQAPSLSNLELNTSQISKDTLKLIFNPDACQSLMNSHYCHTGSTVFCAEMHLSGIDKVLLLPVAPNKGDIAEQMTAMNTIFGEDQRFSFGWSVPNGLKTNEIQMKAEEVMEQYPIKAIKLHPNVTGLNVKSSSGMERYESILNTSDRCKLPLIIHGGRSPIAKDRRCASNGQIENLAKIDWSVTRSPVVIAHAGAYGCKPLEVQNSVLPKMNSLLEDFDNLLIDISGLDTATLILIINSIDIDRIIFGSDALYFPQWSQIVKLLYALKKTTKNAEESFARIVSINPENYIFLREHEKSVSH